MKIRSEKQIAVEEQISLLTKQLSASNGLSVEQWQEVDWNDYITLWEER